MEAYLMVNTIADTSSPLYEQMLNDGLINSEFGTEVFNGDGFFTIIFGGESSNPREVKDRIFKAIKEAKEFGLDKKRFEIIKKSTYGGFIREFNDVTAMANGTMNAYFSGVNPFDSLNVLTSITYEDVQKCLIDRLDLEKSVLSIIE